MKIIVSLFTLTTVRALARSNQKWNNFYVSTLTHAYRKPACDTAQIRSVKCHLFHTTSCLIQSLDYPIIWRLAYLTYPQKTKINEYLLLISYFVSDDKLNYCVFLILLLLELSLQKPAYKLINLKLTSLKSIIP